MITMQDLGVATPTRDSIFHPEHPLHHLVLDFIDQVRESLQKWVSTAAPKLVAEE